MEINYKYLKTVCLAPIDQFSPLGVLTQTKRGRHIFIDRKANILAVAHLDTVQHTDHFYHLVVDGRDYVLNAQLDDRLGAYVILSLLWKQANYDILLTEGEESGQSTAADFTTTKKYKWMFSFDRRGDDVVHYQYGSNTLKKHLRKAGLFRIEHGSYSDIAYLDNLGCEGFNMGVGYKDEHSKWAMADMGVTLEQATRFLEFYKKFQNTAYPYSKPVYKAPQSGSAWGARGGFGREWDEWYGDDPRTDSAAFRRGQEQTPWYKRTPAYLPLPKSETDEEMCIYCQRPLTQVDDAAEHPGACLICDGTLVQCPICAEFAIDEQMVDGICKTCFNRLSDGYSMMSHVKCPKCQSRLMTTELRALICMTCKTKFKPPKFKLPELSEPF